MKTSTYCSFILLLVSGFLPGAASASCSSGCELLVDVRTDYRPGIDFFRVRTDLVKTATGEEFDNQFRKTEVDADTDAYSGFRVAEFTGLPGGSYRATITLIDDAGGVLDQKEIDLVLDSSWAFTAVLVEDCHRGTLGGYSTMEVELLDDADLDTVISPGDTIRTSVEVGINPTDEVPFQCLDITDFRYHHVLPTTYAVIDGSIQTSPQATATLVPKIDQVHDLLIVEYGDVSGYLVPGQQPAALFHITYDAIVGTQGDYEITTQGSFLNGDLNRILTDDNEIPGEENPTVVTVYINSLLDEIDTLNIQLASVTAERDSLNTQLDATTGELNILEGRFSDLDSDGVPAFWDFCPDSNLTGETVVDAAGCTHSQFCAQFDTSTGSGSINCDYADFLNNNTSAKADCEIDKKTIKCVPVNEDKNKSKVDDKSYIPVVDQSQPINDLPATIQIGDTSDQIIAQVVTAGFSGQFVQVDWPVYCQPGSDLSLEIHGVRLNAQDQYVPDDSVLGSTLISSAGLPPFDDINNPEFRQLLLPVPVTLEAGAMFSIVLNSEGECATGHGPEGNPYDGGDSWYVNNAVQEWTRTNGTDRMDFPFKTWVQQ